MAWHLPESDLIDEILLAAGKALYLANQFEFRCKIALKVADAEEFLRDDPAAPLDLATVLDAKRRWDKIYLNHTLKGMAQVPPGVTEHQALALEKARVARNYIAHEAAGAIGELSGYDVQPRISALRKLHNAVIDLVKGDSIVSAWIYQIEEPREPIPPMTDYVEQAASWVFGHLPREWLDPGWKPDHRRPRTVREAVFYKRWYSRPRL